MRISWWAALALCAGCGSSWNARGGGVDVLINLSFFRDVDGDGWGEFGSVAAEGDAAKGEFTAQNSCDCDDGSALVTGRIGPACPEALLSPTPSFDGLISAGSEYVFVYGADTPVERYLQADLSCAMWAGLPIDAAATEPPIGALATFATQNEVRDAEDAIAADLDPSGTYAGFVGIGWEGPLDCDPSDGADGAWSWLDDSPDTLITSAFSWCGGVEPTPCDFFPDLNPDDPDHLDAFERDLSWFRLAMVRQPNGEWCLGLPTAAVPASAGTDDPVRHYTEKEAHFVCERAEPDPDDFLVACGDPG